MTRTEVADAIAEAIRAERVRLVGIIEQASEAQRIKPTSTRDLLYDLRWAIEHADADGIVPEALR